MSHGPVLVRTTCSTGAALGPGAGAGPAGASPSEGLLDPVYPRTHSALLKVVQMVRERRAPGAGHRGGREGRDPGRRGAGDRRRAGPPEHRAAGGAGGGCNRAQKFFSSSFLFSGPRYVDPEPGLEESPWRRR
ncbi:CKLF-like MARVEL transmembrane domain-containing protein 7 [Galemys pyrenaicus]|uniref:CKLF-like MARVEL transmembrane domain-containing protein 7 n=1 Tax=Galemys pyrenaicus TaxID=202257 RepID=A0A8J6ARL7_GALPY|nr:CKLF-like MARVEL transmembrane domain-containing protein 7 [Galemys pyrenaicus]